MGTNKGSRPIANHDGRMTSFHTGRQQMQKLHVDAILYKGLKGEADANPGPGQHDISR